MDEKMDFLVKGVNKVWEKYGIIEKIGHFENLPKTKKLIIINTPNLKMIETTSLNFIPIPNMLVRELVRRLANEYNLQIMREVENDTKYSATVRSEKLLKDVSVGDPIAWGMIIQNDILGSFRVTERLLRLQCTNGLVFPSNEVSVTIQKSYDAEKLYKSLSDIAKSLQERFDEKIEFLKRLKQYTMNAQFAQLLASKFPLKLLNGLIEGKKIDRKTAIVLNFAPMNLYDAYQTITFNMYHNRERPLAISTEIDWGADITSAFMEEMERQEKERQNKNANGQ